jgi:hypothetical protein
MGSYIFNFLISNPAQPPVSPLSHDESDTQGMQVYAEEISLSAIFPRLLSNEDGFHEAGRLFPSDLVDFAVPL